MTTIIKPRITPTIIVTDNGSHAIGSKNSITVDGDNNNQGVNRFDQLIDVVEVSSANGGLPFYDASDDKYKVRKIQSTDLDDVGLDGGFF